MSSAPLLLFHLQLMNVKSDTECLTLSPLLNVAPVKGPVDKRTRPIRRLAATIGLRDEPPSRAMMTDSSFVKARARRPIAGC